MKAVGRRPTSYLVDTKLIDLERALIRRVDDTVDTED